MPAKLSCTGRESELLCHDLNIILLERRRLHPDPRRSSVKNRHRHQDCNSLHATSVFQLPRAQTGMPGGFQALSPPGPHAALRGLSQQPPCPPRNRHRCHWQRYLPPPLLLQRGLSPLPPQRASPSASGASLSGAASSHQAHTGGKTGTRYHFGSPGPYSRRHRACNGRGRDQQSRWWVTLENRIEAGRATGSCPSQELVPDEQRLGHSSRSCLAPELACEAAEIAPQEPA